MNADAACIILNYRRRYVTIATSFLLLQAQGNQNRPASAVGSMEAGTGFEL